MSGRADADERQRLRGVDAVRFIAFVAVCVIHTARWGRDDPYQTDLGDWLTLTGRFAVPFFFLLGGYFSVGRDRSRAIWRLMLVFATWALVYVCLTAGGPGRLWSPRFDLLTLIDGGPGYHLWFLPALAVGLAVAWTTQGRSPQIIWCAVGATWLVGWAAASLGPGRLGPYAGRYLSATAFVVAGALWRTGGGERAPLRLSIALIVVGLALQFFEASLLSAWRVRPVGELEFGLGAGPVGVGVFLAALAWRPSAPPILTAARFGQAALGLYAVHLGVAMVLFAVLPFATLADRLGVCGLTVLASIVCVKAVRRTPLRPLVQ